MDTTGMVLVGIAVVLLVLYVARRRSRLSRED
jgi:LPXTG-motif cell wall-anchored protein